MEFLKTKEQFINEKTGAVNESVFKMGDIFKVKTTIDVPKSLINGFVSKAKKEHGTDPRENWSDIDMAEMFVNYITKTFVNIDSLPVEALLGASTEQITDTNVEDTAQPVQPDVEEPTEIQGDVNTEVQTDVQAQPLQVQAQPQAQI